MQCPICGYDGIDDEAVFCPHCRYQFLEPEPDMTYQEFAPRDAPRPKRSAPAGAPENPAQSEARLLEVLLLTPALILMIIFSAAIYLAIASVPQLVLHLSSAEIPCAAPASIILGAIPAWIVYRIMLMRL